MTSEPNSINLDEPFIVQPTAKEILLPASEDPISETILYRALNIAELVVRDELSNQNFEGELAGIGLGYYAPVEGSDELGTFYSVGRGNLPLGQEIPVDPDETEEPELDPTINPLSFEFVDRLVERITEAVRILTPPFNLEGHQLLMAIYGTVGDEECCWGKAPECCIMGDEKRRVAYYYCLNGCRIWCSLKPCWS